MSSYRWSAKAARQLTVYVGSGNTRTPLAGSYRAVVERALHDWGASGVVSFVFVPHEHGARIRINWTDSLPTAHPGVTLLTPNLWGELSRADVWVNVDVAPRTGISADQVLYGVVAHELGHALGLPHSTYRGSIMHPVLHTLVVTDADLEALKAAAN